MSAGDLVRVKYYFTGNPDPIYRDGLYVRADGVTDGVDYHIILTETQGEVCLTGQQFVLK